MYLLQAHKRSFPYEGYHPGSHTNTEDSYIGCIAALAKKLRLNKPFYLRCTHGRPNQSRVCDPL